MSYFSKIKDVFVASSLRVAKGRVRKQLLAMTDRQLEDYGFSRVLLEEGVSTWPWRVETQESLPPLAIKNNAAPASFSANAVNQAVKELSAYSDRELADLGVTRGNLKDAVINGRSDIEGQNTQQAA